MTSSSRMVQLNDVMLFLLKYKRSVDIFWEIHQFIWPFLITIIFFSISSDLNILSVLFYDRFGLLPASTSSLSVSPALVCWFLYSLLTQSESQCSARIHGNW